jgi:4-hydroxybenzoyl-CoA thioesterase
MSTTTKEWTFTVPWGATDAAGIVFYPNYLRWMDEATHRYLMGLGLHTPSLYRQQGLTIPLLEVNVRFFGPLRHGDRLRVETAVKAVGGKSFRMGHGFWRDGEKVAEGEELRVWAQVSEGRLVALPVPDSLRAAAAPSEPFP